MRTTLTLDDDVVALIQRQARKHGDSFKHIVNDALRRGLTASAAPAVAEPLATYALDTRAGVDLTRALALSAELEDEALLAKLTLGR
ncbi:MAG: hypothetical protein ACT4NL_00845 [Pseudomarimonas sp.]